MDEIKNLVLKHEREISHLAALQKVMSEQLAKITTSIESISTAIIEMKTAIEQQSKELKLALDMKKELLDINKTLLLEKQSQKETNSRVFERIEAIESRLDVIDDKLLELKESTTFSRWLNDGFKNLSGRASVLFLLILGLLVLGALLGIDIHKLIHH